MADGDRKSGSYQGTGKQMKKITTLNKHIISTFGVERFHGGVFTILREIVFVAKLMHREINKAGIVQGLIGGTGDINFHGDATQKLDIFANERLISTLEMGGECCGVVSEENDEIVRLKGKNSENAGYVLAIDPLDGSSNIDVNVTVGVIFSIYKRKSRTPGPCAGEDFLRAGSEQEAAGYIIFGSSTMLVFTAGKGVDGFTLDPSIGEFCLSHPKIKMPDSVAFYSVNQGLQSEFPAWVKKFIEYCGARDPETNRPYSCRYTGSMVADIHRNMLKGGIFMYPPTRKHPGGKLRLLYECNPLSLIIEQAGGGSTDGERRILDIETSSIHQTTPIFAGSKKLVKIMEKYFRQEKAGK